MGAHQLLTRALSIELQHPQQFYLDDDVKAEEDFAALNQILLADGDKAILEKLAEV